MAATNFTPIILYHTTTASAAPTAGNLNNGELAINITDGKLFYKDNGGTVQVIATKGTGTIGGSTTQVQYNNAGVLAGSANFTFNGTTATINTLNLTNALGTAYGGTALTTYTQGDLVYASAANTLAKLGIGANTYILTSTGSVPQWSAPSAVTVSTANNLAGGAAGSVPYQSGASTTTFLSIGSAGQILSSTGSAPQWSSPAALTKTDDTNVTLTLGGSASTALVNAASLTLGWTGQLSIARGGTNATATPTAGAVAYGTGTAYAFTAAGTSGQVLTSNGAGVPTWASLSSIGVTTFSAGTTGFTPSTATAGAITLAGTLATTNGGTGLTSFTANQVFYASSTSAIAQSANLTFDGSTLTVTGGASVVGTTPVLLQRPVIPSFAGQGAPAIQWQFYSTGTTYTTGAYIQALADAAWSSTSAPTSLRFYTVPSGSTTAIETMRNDASGMFLDTGAGGGRMTFSPGATQNQILSTTTGFAAYNILRHQASQYQWLNASSTQMMTLTSAGDLLVGKTSAALNNTTGTAISGGFITTHSNSGNGTIELGATRAAVAADIGGLVTFRAVYRNSDSDSTTIANIKGFRENATNNNWSSYLAFETTSGSTLAERARIASTGNMAIGTTDTANGRLNILAGTSGTGNSLFLSNLDGTYNPYLQVQHIGINGIRFLANSSYGGTAGNINFAPAGADSVVFNTSGYVGIGITSPAQLLDVRSANTTGATGATIRVGSQAHGGSGDEFANLEFYWGDPDAAGVKAKIYTKNVGNIGPGGGGAADLLFGTTPAFGSVTERMRLTSQGKFGVGTNPDTYDSIFTTYATGSYSSGNVNALFVNPTGRGTVRIRSEASEACELFFDTGGGVAWDISCRSVAEGKSMLWFPAATTPSYGNVNAQVMTLTQSGNLTITGALAKGSGSFLIEHPLPALSETHNLVHSFVEAPQADLYYRGKVTLVNGKATVNIDEAAGMTDGTFVLLNREVQCFTSNESDWDAVRGSVSGNILTIECQNASSNATISWMVVGERQDKHMYDTDWTDENGKVIVEPIKPPPVEPPTFNR